MTPRNFKTIATTMLSAMLVVLVSVMGVRAYAQSSATLWSVATIPGQIDSDDGQAVELGVRFRAAVDGQITGIRFYKAPTNTGIHVGSLWNNSGMLLAQATFGDETASGWQQVNFSTPIPIAANVTFVASYHAPVGHYSDDLDYFAGGDYVSGNLSALQDGTDGQNGVYQYGSDIALPANTYQSTNYWIDVTFTPGPNPAPPTAPANLIAKAASGSLVNLTWTPSTDVVGIVAYRIFRNGGAVPLAQASGASYADSTVAADTTYSYQVMALDAAGNASALSNVAVVHTLPPQDTTPPTAPANLSAVVAGAIQANLSWAASTDNVGVVGYLVFRGGQQIASVPTVGYADKSIAINNSYTYSVKAFDAVGNISAASNSVTVSTSPITTPAGCGCSGNPGVLTSDAQGACLTYAAPSGRAHNITFRFHQPYACGQYATGEYFVVAKGSGGVNITAIDPASTSGYHGVDVNPSPLLGASQRWDIRLADHIASMSLPYTAQPGDSVVKFVSSNPGGNCGSNPDHGLKSCDQFAAVLTVLGAAPANPGKLFRPPYVGTYKPTFSTDQLQVDQLLRLNCPAATCPDQPNRTIAEAWTHGLRLDYVASSVNNDYIPPEDNIPEGRPWSTDIWARDTDLMAWLNLGNVCSTAATAPCTAAQDNAAKRATLIGLVQLGIDTWATNKAGGDFERGGGGNSGGKLTTLSFAATMLNDAGMLADLAAINGANMFESETLFQGIGTDDLGYPLALWGQPTDTEAGYWAGMTDSHSTVRDPYGYIDGGLQIRSSPDDEGYQGNTSMPIKYTALLLRLMPAWSANWPELTVYGRTHSVDSVLDYADRWVRFGRWTQPDPCAPLSAGGGPDGRGGCILSGGTPSGRFPSAHGTSADTGNRMRNFGEQMWSAFRSCAPSRSCPVVP